MALFFSIALKAPDGGATFGAAVEKLAVYATPPASPAQGTPVAHPLPEAFVLGRMSGMEGDEQEHQRRQYEHQPFSRGFVPNYRTNLAEGNASGRLRQGQIVTGRCPTPGSTVPAGGTHHHQELGNIGYQQGPQYPAAQMQGSSLQYSTDYNQEAQRPQNFPQYMSQVVYNVPQQNQPRSPYEAVPQYQPRQSAALEVLSNQFGVSQYYNPHEAMGALGHTSTPQQYAPSQFNQSISYQTPGAGRSTIASPYPVGMTEYAQGTAQEGPPDMAEQQEEESANLADEYNNYQEALKATFEKTSKGRLIEAGRSLLEISEWLLGHTKELGLVSDDESRKEERLRLWTEFNTCWLALLQGQKEATQQMLDTEQRPHRPQSVLGKDFLGNMAETLVHHCDGLEKYGLVDYQTGVWEEEIMSILTQCLDTLDENDPDPAPGENFKPQIQEG
ncbi:MAG: hypothetical protein Q9223_000633 [Gallowayella weberi]